MSLSWIPFFWRKKINKKKIYYHIVLGKNINKITKKQQQKTNTHNSWFCNIHYGDSDYGNKK